LIDAPPGRREKLAVLAGCAVASLVAIAWSWTHGAMLNYGDAVAHLHIARRVFDSHFPGYSQLGSVWLPLPHVLMMPFVLVYAWWANGIAGLIPSALAWLASCYGLYRLARRWMRPIPAAIALAFFALNPNLLYLQTTAMTEPLFVCEMVWAAVWLVEWRASLDTQDAEWTTRRLTWLLAMVLVAAVYTRYDGWIMTLLAWTAMGIALLRRGRLASPSFWAASIVVIAAPVAWLLYNQFVFGDWLAFARGPYSAKAIELRTALRGGPPHPGWHNPWVSFLFYVKTTELDAAAEQWGGLLLAASLIGLAWALLTARKRAFAWSLLLWLPVPFYAYSVAFGSVPIFLPVWWPYSFYNTRYGVELLPALALSLGFAASFALAAVREGNPRWVRAAVAIMFALIGANLGLMLKHRALVYVEGTKNIDARRSYEQEIPPVLRVLLAQRPGGEVLMVTSVYPDLVAFTGIPLRQTVNEGDQELWQDALSAPAQHAALVLAFAGDPVERAVHEHPAGLRLIRRFTAPGQPAAALYVSDTSGSLAAASEPVR
jgi:hypothetical protein